MLNENNLIEKSKSLVWAKFNTYTANELKLLEVYLSKINARDPGSSLVEFTKSEYCSLMGLHPDTKTEYIKKYTEHFLGNVLTLNVGSGYRQYTLFTYAECVFDEEIGQNVIKIKCNPDLAPVFFNLAEDGYIRYKLKNVISLKSQYSVRLYSLLKDRSYGNHEWSIGLKELRELLGATDKSYEKFKEFNRTVLQKCEKEINENTDINFTYERIVRGRLTRGITFKIKRKRKESTRKVIDVSTELEGQTTWADDAPVIDTSGEIYAFPVEKNDEENYKLYAETLDGYNFTAKQIKELGKMAEKMVPAGTSFECIPLEIHAADLLKEKIEVLEENKAKNFVEDDFRLLYAALKNNWKPNHPMNKELPDWDDFMKVPVFE